MHAGQIRCFLGPGQRKRYREVKEDGFSMEHMLYGQWRDLWDMEAIEGLEGRKDLVMRVGTVDG